MQQTETTRIVGSSVSLDDLPVVDIMDPDTYVSGDGRLSARNGVATMKYEGEYQFCPIRRSYRDDEAVVLDMMGPDGLSGEIELSAVEAMRLGMVLFAHGENEYEANGGNELTDAIEAEARDDAV